MLLENKRILLFEDNLDNVQLIVTILEDEGAKVRVWYGGGKAAMLTMLPLDLIIMDLMLSERHSGFAHFDQIRTWPEMRKVPIVAVSAMDQTLAVPTTRAMGFSGFISKPIDMDLFPQQILDVINGKQVWYTNPSVRR
ncbi:MAG: response regulator [Anaerolineae bacterium]|nr:response regulator [Anaerolineae bacterium]